MRKCPSGLKVALLAAERKGQVMGRRTVAVVAAIGVLSIVLTGGSVAQAAKKKKPVPAFRIERTFFECAGDHKLQNIPAATGDLPTWSTTEPSASVLDGAGCGHFENTAPSPLNAVFEGTFTGNLRAMSFELYAIDIDSARVTNVIPFGFTVSVDGEEAFVSDHYDIDVEYVNEMVTSKMVFSLTGLPFGAEIGTGKAERTIRLELDTHNDMQTLWVWSTSEVPAGITFNPSTLEATVFEVAP